MLKYRYPDTPNYGDICEISNLPYFDLLTGGSPCQDFSMAGKKAGFNGDRGKLFFEFIRLLEENQPKYFLFENVKGLLTNSGGRTFGKMLVLFSEAGYDCQWQVLNAKYFGVPQNRDRVFITGYLRGNSRREIFFDQQGGKRHYNKAGSKTENNTEGIAKCLNSGGNDGGFRTEPGEHLIVSALTSYSGGVDDNDAQAGVLIFSTQTRNPERPSLKYSSGGSGFLCKKEGDETTFCVDTGNTQAIYHNGVRKMIPLECERLMGVPDDWTKFGNFSGKIKQISDTQRYKMLGNGVVPNVPREIIKRLRWIEKN